MPVDPDTAIAATHAGITYRFCSEPCRARFTADPARYVASTATHRPLGREAGSRKRSSPMPMVIVAFVAVAMVLLFAAPRTGVASVLPYLLVLACPFLHLLFHRRHRHDH
jgi:YHS domain-containing protein